MSYFSVPVETDPYTLASNALIDLAQRIPGYVPREGHLEVAIVEVVARLVAQNRDQASVVPDAIFRAIGKSLFGVQAVEAARATVRTTWTTYDSAGYTIPAGTTVGYRLGADSQAYFRTTEPITISQGLTSTQPGEVELEALEPGASFNGLPVSEMVLVDALVFVKSITSTTTTSGGADRESDAAYENRLAARLRLLAPRPITAPDFAVLARDIPGVDRAVAIDGYNPISGTYENERMVVRRYLDPARQ